MRVIAGSAGGIRLDVPKTAVRPTMDRVKAAIFSSLGEEIIGARVLDLFAGTGALGIEALSRGAGSVLFVEENDSAVAVIERNLARTKLEGRIRKQDVIRQSPADDSHSYFWKTPSSLGCWNRPGFLFSRNDRKNKCRPRHYGRSPVTGVTVRPRFCFCNRLAL
jgi:hypothetical protein